MTQPPPPFLADTQLSPVLNDSINFLRCIVSVFDRNLISLLNVNLLLNVVQSFSRTDSFSHSATSWFVSPIRIYPLSYLLLLFNPLPKSDLQFQHSDGTDAMRQCKQQQQ